MGLLEAMVVALTSLGAVTWLIVVARCELRLAPSQLAPAYSDSPRWDVAVARAWLTAPLWVPVAVVVSALLPGIWAAAVGGPDHCLAAQHHHHHLCLFHPPHLGETGLDWLVPLLGALALGFRGAPAARRILLERRIGKTLVALSRPSSFGDDVRLLEQRECLALTVGYRKPAILISDGLVDSLDADSLAVVLAHERAHASRGDNAWAAFDRLAAAMLPRRAAAPLLDRIALAREQRCDAVAAEAVASPIRVAQALVRVARIEFARTQCGLSVVGQSVGHMEARVRLLLSSRSNRNGRTPLVLAGVGCLLIGLGAGPAHALVEEVVTYFLH